MRDSRGLTLIEVVVATAVFGLVVIVLGGFFAISSSRSLLGQDVTAGALLAQQRIEFLKAKQASSLSGFAATETLDELGNASPSGQFTRTTTVTTPVLGTTLLTQVDVTVTWLERGLTRTVTLSSLIGDF